MFLLLVLSQMTMGQLEWFALEWFPLTIYLPLGCQRDRLGHHENIRHMK